MPTTISPTTGRVLLIASIVGLTTAARAESSMPTLTIVVAADPRTGGCGARPLYYVQGTRVYLADAGGAQTRRIIRHVEAGRIYAADARGGQTGRALRHLVDDRVHAADPATGGPTRTILSYIRDGKVYAADPRTGAPTTRLLRCIRGLLATD